MIGIFLAILLSGVSGLTYEISWQLVLGGILGSDASSSTVVIASFLSGLSTGYFLFGYLIRRVPLSFRSLLIATGVVELGIGSLGSLFPLLASALNGVTLHFSDEARALFFGLILILPPTILMGGTLPLLSQAASQKEESWVQSHAKLYGANTFGGFLGVIGAVFLFLPNVGGRGSIFLAAFGNVLSAFLLFGLASREKEVAVESVPEHGAETEALSYHVQSLTSLSLPLFASFLVGFSTLSVQVVLLRIGSLILGSSYYLFSIILGVYIFWLALGGYFAVPRRKSFQLYPSFLLFVAILSLALVGYILQFAPYFAHLIRIQFALDRSEMSLYLLALFLATSALLFLPLLCFGAFEPALVRKLSENTKNSAGRIVGWCYGMNTAGSVLGVVLSGMFLFSFMSLDQIFSVAIALLGFALFMLLKWEGASGSRYLCSLLLMGSVLLPKFSSDELGIGLFRLQQKTPFSELGARGFFENATQHGVVKFARDGKTTTSVVMEFSDTSPPSRTIFLNGKADGNTVGDKVNMNMIGALASALSSPEAERVGLLGFGTGMTAGALGRFNKYQDIVVFELDENAPVYAEFFREAAYSVTDDQRLSWRIGDALRLIPREREVFDVFISQPSNPWVTGMERLYSKEFYETVKGKLSPQGLFVTWFAGSAIGEKSVQTLLYTFRRAFQGMRIFQFGRDYILVGWNGAVGDNSIEQVFSKPDSSTYLKSFGFSHPALLLAHELWFLPPQIGRAPIQSLYQPYLSILGAGDFFQESEVDLFAYFHSGAKWYYQLLGQKRSLLAELGVDFASSDTHGLLKALIAKGCGGEQVRLQEPLWRTERTLCRDALIAAMAYGLAPVPESLRDSFQWIDDFRNDKQALMGSDWKQELTSFALFESIFLQLHPDNLITRLSLCFDTKDPGYSEECQVTLARTLSLTGNHQAAMKISAWLPTDLNNDELKEYLRVNNALISSS